VIRCDTRRRIGCSIRWKLVIAQKNVIASHTVPRSNVCSLAMSVPASRPSVLFHR
jgi:hypothetical protein